MPRFSRTGLLRASSALEQRKILHVAGADLDHVSVFLDQVERLVIDGLGDDLHAELLADVGHDAQAFFAESLKSVGRSARLVGSAAEKLGSGAMHALGRGEGLFAGLDAAGASHNRESWTADGRGGAGKGDDRVVLLDVAANQFVGLRNADDFLHARHFFERAVFEFALVAGDADGGAGGSGHGMRPEAEGFDFLANGADLIFSRVRLHDDEHNFTWEKIYVGAVALRLRSGQAPGCPSSAARLLSSWVRQQEKSRPACHIKSTVPASAPQSGLGPRTTIDDGCRKPDI